MNQSTVPIGLNEYAALMGQILANLQGLEFALRTRLSYDDPPHMQLPAGKRLQELKAGDRVPENSFTGYETLGRPIEHYNGQVANSDPDLTVDPDIVTLRDALAHGRASSLPDDADADTVLLKFSRPENGQVTVTFSECLTREWLNIRVRRVFLEVRKVFHAMDRARVRLRNQREAKDKASE